MAWRTLVAVSLALSMASAEVPADIAGLTDKILAVTERESTNDRLDALLRLASILQLHFPQEAKKFLLQAEAEVKQPDDRRTIQIYAAMRHLDPAEAKRIGDQIKDRAGLYNAQLQQCAETRDLTCGQRVLSEAHRAGAYRIFSTRWVIDQLVIKDPPAARAAFKELLRLFPQDGASFEDVQVLLHATDAIAKIDPPLAKQAAAEIEKAVRDPGFETRSYAIVTARFLIDGKQVDTKSTRETVLLQTQSLLNSGRFPHALQTQFAIRQPRTETTERVDQAAQETVNALFEELTNRVQERNDFKLKSTGGTQYRLTALRGQPVLLDFWATWCVPCREEMPRLEALSRKGVSVLAITDENEELVHKFVAANHYTLPILLDSDGKVFQLYGVIPRPTTLLIDSEGKITSRWIGLPEDAKLQDALVRAKQAKSQ